MDIKKAIDILRVNNTNLDNLLTGDKESDKVLLDKIGANNIAIQCLEMCQKWKDRNQSKEDY